MLKLSAKELLEKQHWLFQVIFTLIVALLALALLAINGVNNMFG